MNTEDAYLLGVEHGYQIGSDLHIPTHDERLFNAMALDAASRALFSEDHPLAENFSSETLKLFLRGEMDGFAKAYKERFVKEHDMK